MTYRQYINILSIIAICIFVFVIVKYSLNIPIYDDYDIVVRHIYLLSIEKISLQDEITFLFSQHNEHRVVVSRLFVLCQWYLTNVIDIKHLIILSNIIFSIGLFFVLNYITNTLFEGYQTLIATLIAYLLIYNFINWDDFLYYPNCPQHPLSIIFSMVALICLDKYAKEHRNIYFVFCIVFSMIATYSFSSSLVLPPVAVVYLIVIKDYKKFVWYCVFIIPVTLLYFWGYKTTSDVPPFEFWRFFKYSIQSSGAYLNIGTRGRPSGYLPIYIIGLFSWIWIAFLLSKKYLHKNTLLFCMIILLFGMLLILNLGRTVTGGLAAVSRYQIYFSFFGTWIILSILRYFLENRIIWSSIFLFVVIQSFISYNDFEITIKNKNDDIIRDFTKWQSKSSLVLEKFTPKERIVQCSAYMDSLYLHKTYLPPDFAAQSNFK